MTDALARERWCRVLLPASGPVGVLVLAALLPGLVQMPSLPIIEVVLAAVAIAGSYLWLTEGNPARRDPASGRPLWKANAVALGWLAGGLLLGLFGTLLLARMLENSRVLLVLAGVVATVLHIWIVTLSGGIDTFETYVRADLDRQWAESRRRLVVEQARADVQAFYFKYKLLLSQTLPQELAARQWEESIPHDSSVELATQQARQLVQRWCGLIDQLREQAMQLQRRDEERQLELQQLDEELRSENQRLESVKQSGLPTELIEAELEVSHKKLQPLEQRRRRLLLERVVV
jgi:hypothetical protein